MITRAEVLHLRHRLSQPRVFGTGQNLERESIVVRLEDGDAVVGWGETYALDGVRAATEALVAPLVGRAPEDAAAELAGAHGLHRWALGAVSVALDDLRARRRGIPIGELYRPRDRDRVFAYASSRGYAGSTAAEGWHDEARLVHDAGFRALKLRIGRYAPRDEVAAVAEVVRHGPAFTWMADGNGAYGLDDALLVGRALEGLGLRWLEEPLPTHDYPAYAPLAAALAIPLAGGEILESPDLAEPPLAAGAFDIVQPDLAICGGFPGLLAIVDRATARGVATVPHASNGGILLAATLQLLAVLPVATGAPAWAQPILEYDVGENPIRDEVFGAPIPVVDGEVAIPAAPGLGFEVDEAHVRRLAA